MIRLSLIEAEATTNLDAGDVRALFWMFMHDKYTVYPRESLSVNIGNDNSGEHCGKTDRFDTALSDKLSFHFTENIQEDANIIGANANFFEVSFKHRRKQYLRQLAYKILPTHVVRKLQRMVRR